MDNPHQIATLADLRFLSENTNYGGSGTNFIQTADIDATETNTWNVGNHDGDAGTADVAMGFSPIGNFWGSYDGQGHTISNLYINRPATDNIGFFAFLVGTVTNIGLTNVFIVGHDNVGALIGKNNDWSSVTNCFSTGSVKGNKWVGGLVGLNFNGSISTSYSNVNAEGNNNIGGLIGEFYGGNISNSYATGSVRGNSSIAGFIGTARCYFPTMLRTIDKCYAVGVVTGNVGSINVGGFIGANDAVQPAIVTNCYWDTQTSGQTTSAAGRSKTTLEMKTQATYSGWNFTTTTPIWKINSANNSGYPYLTWQIIPIATNSSSSALNLSGTSNIQVAAGVTLTLDANATVNRLILAPTAKLSLGTNTLNAPNGVVLESSADGTATILGDNAVSNATVQQYVTAGRNWYISSPLSGAGYTDLSRGVSVVEWNEATKNWDTKSSGTLTQGKGYIQVADAIQTGTTGTLSFGGTTNAGNIDVAVTRTESGNGPGFNLVGNPYPSYLNWSSFISEATNVNISRTYWYRTKNTIGGYTFVTYNGVGGTHVTSNGTANTSISGKIPPMQGFWIRVNSGTASTTARFTNAMREHRDGDQNIFKAPKLDERACLRLQLINGAKSDETMIYFDENAANQYDDYDSPKMMNNSDVDPDLYTKAGNERLVINGLKSLTDNLELPLGFNLNAPANLKIKAGELANFKTGTRIFLLDKTEKTQTELYPETEYSFSTKTAAINNENRFSLLFRTAGISTDIDKAGEQAVNVFVDATNQLIVAAPLNSSYVIYNAVGQQINSGITTSYLQTINCKLNSGIYVVKVVDNGKELTTRIIIK